MKRKTVGWLIFAALLAVILAQIPSIAATGCYRLGTKFRALGNHQAAAKAFGGAVFLNSHFARAYVELGSSYLALKKYALAEKAFLKAKSIDDESCASCGLGMTYRRLGRHDEAEREFKRAINLNPADVCAYDELGRMYYDAGKYEEAIAAFKRALTLRPSFGTYMYLGHSYVYARDFEHGAETYKEAIKFEPEDETAHFSLALTYLSLHNRPAALEQYEILKRINPKQAAELIAEPGFEEGRELGKQKLYFVPLSGFPAASLTKLVNFCKQKTGIQPILTQPVPFALSTIDKRREQVIAEEAVELMKLRYPNLAADPNAIVIGLTDEDMYIRKETWQFAFSYRTQGRFAVVSSARMNPVNVGGPANDGLLESRLRKVVLKNIGILYYLWPPNYNPKSVLYSGIGGLDDLDNMSEDF